MKNRETRTIKGTRRVIYNSNNFNISTNLKNNKNINIKNNLNNKVQNYFKENRVNNTKFTYKIKDFGNLNIKNNKLESYVINKGIGEKSVSNIRSIRKSIVEKNKNHNNFTNSETYRTRDFGNLNIKNNMIQSDVINKGIREKSISNIRSIRKSIVEKNKIYNDNTNRGTYTTRNLKKLNLKNRNYEPLKINRKINDNIISRRIITKKPLNEISRNINIHKLTNISINSEIRSINNKKLHSLDKKILKTKFDDNLRNKRSLKSSKKEYKNLKKGLSKNRKNRLKNTKHIARNVNNYYFSNYQADKNIDNYSKDVQNDLINDKNRIKSIGKINKKFERNRKLKKTFKQKKLDKRMLKVEKKALKKNYKLHKKELKQEIYNNLKRPTNFRLYNKVKVEAKFRKERGLARLRSAKNRGEKIVKAPVNTVRSLKTKTGRTISSSKKFLVNKEFRLTKIKSLKKSFKGGIKNTFKSLKSKLKIKFLDTIGYLKRTLFRYAIIIFLPFALMVSCFNSATTVNTVAYTTSDDEAVDIDDYFRKKELELQKKVQDDFLNRYSVGDVSTYNGVEMIIKRVKHRIAPIGHRPEDLLAYLSIINSGDTFKLNKDKLDEIFDRVYQYYDKLYLELLSTKKEEIVLDGEGNPHTKINTIYYYTGTYEINVEKKDFKYLIIEDFRNGAEYTKEKEISEITQLFDSIVDSRGSWQILVSPFENGEWLGRKPEMQGYKLENGNINYYDYEDNYMYLTSKEGEDIYTLDGMDYSETTVNYYENSRSGILELIIDDTTIVYLKGVTAIVNNGDKVTNNVEVDPNDKNKQIRKRAKIGKANSDKIGIIIRKNNIDPETGKTYGFFSLKKSEVYVNPYLYLTMYDDEKEKYLDSVLMTQGVGEFILNEDGNFNYGEFAQGFQSGDEETLRNFITDFKTPDSRSLFGGIPGVANYSYPHYGRQCVSWCYNRWYEVHGVNTGIMGNGGYWKTHAYSKGMIVLEGGNKNKVKSG